MYSWADVVSIFILGGKFQANEACNCPLQMMKREMTSRRHFQLPIRFLWVLIKTDSEVIPDCARARTHK